MDRRHFHDGNLIAAIDALRDVHFLEIVRQAIVKRLEPIDLALNAIELREPLAQIERLGLPFLDVALQVLHLFADGLAARLELFHGVLPVELDQIFCFVISSLSLMIFGCFGRKSLESVSFSALSNCSACFAFR